MVYLILVFYQSSCSIFNKLEEVCSCLLMRQVATWVVIAFYVSFCALNQRWSDTHKREFVYGGALWVPECKVIGSSDKVHVVDA